MKLVEKAVNPQLHFCMRLQYTEFSESKIEFSIAIPWSLV